MRRWGLKLAARGGKRAKKAAVIAVARKLGILRRVTRFSESETGGKTASCPDPEYGSRGDTSGGGKSVDSARGSGAFLLHLTDLLDD